METGTETHGITIKEDSSKINQTLINRDNHIEIKTMITNLEGIKVSEIIKLDSGMTRTVKDKISIRITSPSIIRETAITSHLTIKQDRLINHMVRAIQYRQKVIKIKTEMDSGTIIKTETTSKTDLTKNMIIKIITGKEDIVRTLMISKIIGRIIIIIDREEI